MPSSSSKAQKTKSASRSDSGRQTTSYNRSASAGGNGSGSSAGGSALYGGYTPPVNLDGTERDPFGSRAYDSDDSEEDGDAQMRKYHAEQALYHGQVTANNNLARENARRMAEQTRYGSTGGSSSAGASSRSGLLAGGGPSSHSSDRRKPRKTVKFNSEPSSQGGRK